MNFKSHWLDASTMEHPGYRKGTVAGALASVLGPLPVGEGVLIESCVDSFGREQGFKKIRDKLEYLLKERSMDDGFKGVKFMTRIRDTAIMVKKVSV